MPETSFSLLGRLRVAADNADWQRLVEIYQPLLCGWLRRQSAPETDVDDLVQEVLTVVLRRLPDFEHNGRTGAFRAWLRQISVNCLRDFWRAKRLRPLATGTTDFGEMLDALADSESGLSRLWDAEHDRHVTRKLLELIEPRFAPSTWEAFRRVAVAGEKPDDVAASLGLSVNAVFVAKSRVLAALRQEAAGLLDI